MASQTLSTATSGLLFGAALSAAGVASPSIIISQLRLENFHMLEVFLTATAGSALIIHLTKRASLAPCPPRSPAAWGYFPYDGNIVGCLLLGAGMALTGSCPGTVLVQVGMGLRSGFTVLAGSLVGGALFVGYAGGFRRATPAAVKGEEKPKLTIPQRCGVAQFPAVVAYQVICLSVVGAALGYLPDEQGRLLNPLIGGSLMGLAQLASLLLTTNTLGVSSAYESFGKLFWRAVTPSSSPWPSVSPLVFAAGVAGGSAAFWRLSGTFPAKGVERQLVSTYRPCVPNIPPLAAITTFPQKSNSSNPKSNPSTATMRINTVIFAIAALFASASVAETTDPDKSVEDLAKCTTIERFGPFGNHCGGCRQDWHFVPAISYVACNAEKECCGGHCCPNMMTIQEEAN
ncbi:hypothetical protein V500_07982 [Pseudogymnoascus sp. VKM F-4518 (FW-2643)]|nr:hypothetical protein V500_07982 [Pseudogymnoascus sp. VKM F-4518 (FW-2643)]